MKKNKVVYMISGIFLFIGIGFLIGAVCYGVYFADFKSGAVKVTGEITEIREYYDIDNELEHRAYVSYSYEDKNYENVPLNSYSSSMYKGKEMELLCDARHPEHIMEGTVGVILMSVFGGIGILFTLIGIIPLIVVAKGKKKKKELLENGRVIYATVDSIQMNTSYSVNGSHPYVIYCSYKDIYKDVIYQFKSENLWGDPFGIFPQGSTIGVYVMPEDYSRYYVDTQSVMGQRIVDYT